MATTDTQVLSVLRTEGIEEEAFAEFRRELAEVLPVEETGPLYRHALEAPQYIELIGRALAWAPLVIAASAYLKRLMEKAADSTWENRWEILNGALGWALSPLRKFAQTIVKAKQRMPYLTAVGVGVQFDEPMWPAWVWIESRDEAEVVWLLAVLIANAEHIEATLKEMLAQGQEIVGSVFLSITPPDAITMKWMDRTGYHELELKVPSE